MVGAVTDPLSVAEAVTAIGAALTAVGLVGAGVVTMLVFVRVFGWVMKVMR